MELILALRVILISQIVTQQLREQLVPRTTSMVTQTRIIVPAGNFSMSGPMDTATTEIQMAVAFTEMAMLLVSNVKPISHLTLLVHVSAQPTHTLLLVSVIHVPIIVPPALISTNVLVVIQLIL
jgi:hypothetical protein